MQYNTVHFSLPQALVHLQNVKTKSFSSILNRLSIFRIGQEPWFGWAGIYVDIVRYLEFSSWHYGATGYLSAWQLLNGNTIIQKICGVKLRKRAMCVYHFACFVYRNSSTCQEQIT